MRLFKWCPGFRPDIESSTAPIWVALPNLPLFLFNKQSLFAIGSLIGKPLTFDTATTKLSRSNVARICVEVELLKRLPHRIWME